MHASFLAAALITAPPSVPEPPTLSLQWTAPASCPSEAAVQAEVGHLLANSEADPSTLRAVASVTLAEDGYHLDLAIEQPSPGGSRELAAATCEEIAAAAALFVAIAIDPTVQPEPAPAPAPAPAPEPAPAPAPAPGPEPAPAPAPEPAPERTPARRRTPHPAAFVRGGAAIGVAPGWGGFVQAGAGVAWRRLELHAVGSGWLPRRAGDGIEGRFQLWAGGFDVCGRLAPHRVIEIPLCAGVHAGAMLGRGLAGLQDARRSTQPWVGMSLDPAVRVRVHRWISLRAGPHLWVSLIRPAFDTEQGTLVHRADTIGGAFTAGLVIGPRP